MSATVIIERYTGAGPTATPMGANTVGGTSDSAQMLANAGLSVAPIRIPISGVNYGYWVTTGLNVTVAPATGINNVRWYTDGTNNLGTGVDISLADQTLIRGSEYDQATGTEGVTGDELVANHSFVTSKATAFARTSGSPLSVTGSIANTTGALGNYVVYQFDVINTASPGPTSQETITWAFDES